MWSYILKRLLLMIPTLFGILLITFIIIQFVPGGPVEQMVAQLQGRDAAGVGEGPARSRSAYRGRQGVDARRGSSQTFQFFFQTTHEPLQSLANEVIADPEVDGHLFDRQFLEKAKSQQ